MIELTSLKCQGSTNKKWRILRREKEELETEGKPKSLNGTLREWLCMVLRIQLLWVWLLLLPLCEL